MIEHLNRLVEKMQAIRAAFGQSRCAQRCAERTGCTPGAREHELFCRQAAGLVPLAELEQGKGGLRSPSHEGRVAMSECLRLATDIQYFLQAAGQIALEHAQARPDVGKKEEARIIG